MEEHLVVSRHQYNGRFYGGFLLKPSLCKRWILA
jgi:hypothetical protein